MPIVVRGGADNPNVEARSWLNSIAAMGTAGDAFWRSAAAGSAVAANKQRIAQSQQAMQFAQEERNLFNAASEDSAANAEHDALAMAGYDAGQNNPEVQSAVMGAVQQYGPPEAQQQGPPQAQQAPQLDPDEQIDLQAAQKFATEHLKTPQGRAQFWQNQTLRMKDRRIRQETERIAGRYQDLLVGLTNSGKAEMFKGQIEAAQGLLDQIRSPDTTPEVDARLAEEVAKIVGVVEDGWRKNEERMAVGAGLAAGLRDTAARFGAKHPMSGRAMALATFIESGVYAPEMAQKLSTGMEAAFLGLVPSPMDPSGDTYVTEAVAKTLIQQQGMNQRADADRQAKAQSDYQKNAVDMQKARLEARSKRKGGGNDSDFFKFNEIAERRYKEQFDPISGEQINPNVPLKSVDDFMAEAAKSKTAFDTLMSDKGNKKIEALADEWRKRMEGQLQEGISEALPTNEQMAGEQAPTAPVQGEAPAAPAPVEQAPAQPKEPAKPTRISKAVDRIKAKGIERLMPLITSARPAAGAASTGIDAALAPLKALVRTGKKLNPVEIGRKLGEMPAEALEALADYLEGKE